MARNKVAPKRREVSIKPQRVPAMLLAYQMNSDMAVARKAIAEATAKARNRVLDLGQVNIDAIVDAALGIAEEARRFADLMRQHTPNTHGHLSVIGETGERVSGSHA